MFIKRILGFIIILTAILGLVTCLIAIVAGLPVLDRVAAGIDNNITSIGGTLDTVSETLRFAQDTSSQVTVGLNTAEISVLNTAMILSQTRPLLSNAGEIVTVDVAGSLDQVQATIPTVAQLASNVDKTLSLLSKVDILGYKLGIDYNPDVPLAQSITAIGNSLNGIPDKLRSMSSSMNATNQALDTTAINLNTIGSNLHDINASFSKFSGLFGTYLQNTTAIKQRLLATQNELRNDLQFIKTGLFIFIAWLALTQLAPLYVGVSLLTGHATTRG
jgi:methyl-accepting chemotaxis protein